jgi:dCTP deaminase
MILSDRDILREIERGNIRIEPFDRKRVGPCSVDLTLDDIFMVFERGSVIDPLNLSEIPIRKVRTDGGKFRIMPGQFVLASTAEKIAISRGIAATLEGLSSLARLGIIVHAAGLVNPGTGLISPSKLVLEISNRGSSDVLLTPGMRIVQIIFHRLTSPAEIGYDERKSSKYVGQEEPIVKKIE